MDSKKNMKNDSVVTVADITDAIEAFAPCGLQEEWDNSGLLVGFQQKPVKKLFTCLEIDHNVIQEAKELAADMIVTHHPLIFHEIRNLRDGNYKDRLVMELIGSGISVYSCHTPFDKVRGGNNDIIMDRLSLGSVRNLKGQEVASAEKMIARREAADIGRIGVLKEPMLYKDVISFAASQLEMSIRQFHAVGSLDREIRTVGVCTGAGADLIEMAAAAGCELFITGDVKYHEARDAALSGMCVLDAGHYGTEKFFAAAMKEKLGKKFDNIVDIIESKIDLEPFAVL